MDYATIKYNSNGDTVWVRKYNGPVNSTDRVYALAVDNQGNVYVTGSSQDTMNDYATIKYYPNGDTAWVRRYNRPGNNIDIARSLTIDAQGNVYVTGCSGLSDATYDYLTIKYNSSGVQKWVATYNGSGNGADIAYSIAVDRQSNVYVTGSSTVSPGPANDFTTIKYDSLGLEQWVQRYNGPGNAWDVAYSIAVDWQSNVYITGASEGLSGDYDYATIKYTQTGAIEEERTMPDATCNTLEVYPNPASSVIRVRVPQMLNQVQGDKIAVKIFDVTGKVIKEIALATPHNDKVAELRVSLKGIMPGVYFVQAGREIIKLIVTK